MKEKELGNNNEESFMETAKIKDSDVQDETSLNDPEVSDDQKKIALLEQEISSLKDTLLRKVAETENLRKRLEKEKNDAEKYANGKFAKDLLVVIDNFDRISENSDAILSKINSDETLKAFFDGIIICGKELVTALKKHGITVIEVSEGDNFDPSYHQAMCEIDNSEHEPGAIIKIFQNGYIYNDRLLRPAMVSVSKKHEI